MLLLTILMHNLGLIIYGTIGILILTIISCLIFIKNANNILRKRKKVKRIEKIELTKNGFQVNYDEVITQFQWSSVEKITGFKVDRITTDVICLKIDFNNKSSYVTEEFEGWRNFTNELLNKFPHIDKSWEGVISNPAFERKETELYDKTFYKSNDK